MNEILPQAYAHKFSNDNDGLATIKGILFGLLLSTPLWLIFIIIIMAF